MSAQLTQAELDLLRGMVEAGPAWTEVYRKVADLQADLASNDLALYAKDVAIDGLGKLVDELRTENERLNTAGQNLDLAYQVQVRQNQLLADEVHRLKSWKESVLAEVGPEPKRNEQQMPGVVSKRKFVSSEYADHYKHRAEHLAAKLVEAQSCEVDARRYRFIRDVPWTTPLEQVIGQHRNAVWDRVIDEAMAQNQPQPDHSEDKLDMVPQPLGGELPSSILFWVCPNRCRGLVDWDKSVKPAVATCKTCGTTSQKLGGEQC